VLGLVDASTTPRQQLRVDWEDTELDALRARALAPSSPRATSVLTHYLPQHLPTSTPEPTELDFASVGSVHEVSQQEDHDVVKLGASAQGGHISLATGLTVLRPVNRDTKRAATKVPGMYPPPDRLLMAQAVDMSNLAKLQVVDQLQKQRAFDKNKYAERVSRMHERLHVMQGTFHTRQAKLRANVASKNETMAAATYSSSRFAETDDHKLEHVPGGVSPTHTPTRAKQLVNANRTHPQFAGRAASGTSSRLSSPEPWIFDGHLSITDSIAWNSRTYRPRDTSYHLRGTQTAPDSPRSPRSPKSMTSSLRSPSSAKAAASRLPWRPAAEPLCDSFPRRFDLPVSPGGTTSPSKAALNQQAASPQSVMADV